MRKAAAGKWDIDWRKLGHAEPKVKSVTEPKFGSGTAPIAVSVAKPKSSTPPAKPQVKPSQNAVALAEPPEMKPPSPETKERVVPLKPMAASVTKPQRPKVPAPAEKPRVMNIIEQKQQCQEKECEVNKMDTNTISTDRTANQSRFSEQTTTVGTIRREEKVNKVRDSIKKDNRADNSRKRGRDLSSGMDLLDIDFMLDVVENIGASDANDLLMRKLIFNELLRTERLHEMDSQALKGYAINEGGLFDKDIQCEALKELTERTLQK